MEKKSRHKNHLYDEIKDNVLAGIANINADHETNKIQTKPTIIITANHIIIGIMIIPVIAFVIELIQAYNANWDHDLTIIPLSISLIVLINLSLWQEYTKRK